MNFQIPWRIRLWLLNRVFGSPIGSPLFGVLQRYSAFHRDPGKLRAKLDQVLRIVDLGLENGKTLQDASILEIGTGWVPLLPCVFWLLGAREVTSVDLHRYYHVSITRKLFEQLLENRECLEELSSRSSDPVVFRERCALLRSRLSEPRKDSEFLFESVPVRYLAPMDATDLCSSTGAIDWYVSNVTLEHVPPETLFSLFDEAQRVLHDRGVMIHLVDLSDHCSHSDRNLTPVNFLRFSDQQWGRMAGCGTAYHNRLRRPEYRKLIETSGFRLIAEEERVPQKALDALTTLTLAEPRWKSMSERELACSNWLVLCQRSDPD